MNTSAVMRTLLKIFGVFAGIVLIILFWALQRVDYTPYFNSDYYSQTRSTLDSISNHLSQAQGSLQPGFGKVSITPYLHADEDDPMEGTFANIPLPGTSMQLLRNSIRAGKLCRVHSMPMPPPWVGRICCSAGITRVTGSGN